MRQENIFLALDSITGCVLVADGIVYTSVWRTVSYRPSVSFHGQFKAVHEAYH